MKKTIITALCIVLLGGAFVSCRDKSRREAIEKSREAWEESLRDSLRLFEEQLSAAQKELPAMREQVEGMLRNFTMVNNPREVEPYYIYTPIRSSYPLTSTGVVARLTKNGAPEVISVLKGANFSAIRFSTPDGAEVTSETVPYDAALNYRTGGLNTVAFTGNQADSLLLFVNSHPTDPITLTFLNPQKTGTLNVSGLQLEALRETASLVKARIDLRRAEMEIPVLGNKIRRLKERDAMKAEAETEAANQKSN